jgi:hypothetical protein
LVTISLRRLIKIILAGSAFFAAFPTSGYADHAWANYHWARTSNPFVLKIGDNLTTSDWKSKLAQASHDWNSPQNFSTTSPLLTAVMAGQSNRRCAMVAGTTQVCNGKYGGNGWLGLATINIVNGTHITRASAKMNDTYFNMPRYNNPNERLHVMCQEVAHAFGLDHQSTDGSSQNSCMDYFSNTGANASSTLSTKPNLHDFVQLSSIYAHVDSSSTLAAVNAFAAAASDISDADDNRDNGGKFGSPFRNGRSSADGKLGVEADVSEASDNPNNWGRLTRQSRNGRSSTYERINTDGSQNITHVYWTIEAAACTGCDHRHDH